MPTNSGCAASYICHHPVHYGRRAAAAACSYTSWCDGPPLVGQGPWPGQADNSLLCSAQCAVMSIKFQDSMDGHVSGSLLSQGLGGCARHQGDVFCLRRKYTTWLTYELWCSSGGESCSSVHVRTHSTAVDGNSRPFPKPVTRPFGT